MRVLVDLTARRLIVFVFDLCAIGLAFVASFFLRFDLKMPPPDMSALMFKALPWVYLIQTPVLIGLGLYRGVWAFASLRDLLRISRAVLIALVLTVSVFFFRERLEGWPRSIFLIDAVLLLITIGGARFVYRAGREAVWRKKADRTRVLIVGAGQTANLIARELISRPELSVHLVGFLDDNPAWRGVQIHGASVLGPLESLEKNLKKHRVGEVIIAIPRLPGPQVKGILEICRRLDLRCRISPPISDVLTGKVRGVQLREVTVEDVLRRDEIKVDDAGVSNWIKGRCVMVTGAGGSIGSELCRQILRFGPSTLILFERSEFHLYEFERELKKESAHFEGTQLAFVIGDILNEKRLKAVFEQYRPEIILHAAAYKHVPLMEINVFEALHNNVVGTYQLASCAAKAGVRHFVFISTDKAVRPTSVMGATKRMAELVIHAIGSRSDMTTTAVRFGNVLDSHGSVLPLFREQIAKGGPVTVTHPEVTRFFMTIPEAAQLVLQASLLGKGGEIFLLDMGEPVLIKELAEELIYLSGLRPNEDIDIVFTGLRPGEKLYEELLVDMSHVRRTTHPKIMVSTQELGCEQPDQWESDVLEFASNASMPPEADMYAWVRKWVPTYTKTTHEVSGEAERTSPGVASVVLEGDRGLH